MWKGCVHNMFDSSDKMKEDRTMDSNESLASLYLNSHDPVFITDKKEKLLVLTVLFVKKLAARKKKY